MKGRNKKYIKIPSFWFHPTKPHSFVNWRFVIWSNSCKFHQFCWSFFVKDRVEWPNKCTKEEDWFSICVNSRGFSWSVKSDLGLSWLSTHRCHSCWNPTGRYTEGNRGGNMTEGKRMFGECGEAGHFKTTLDTTFTDSPEMKQWSVWELAICEKTILIVSMVHFPYSMTS